MFAQQSSDQSQSSVTLDDVVTEEAWAKPSPAFTEAANERHLFRKFRNSDWIAPLFYMVCDITCWILLYGIIGYVRRDAFFVSPFEFMIVDCVVLGVIVQALYIIGGYNRNTETRSLTYTTEHILAMAVSAVLSSLLIYSATTFDHSMKPSRGVLFFSFIAFTPLSLMYRRWIRGSVAATTATKAFLVIGSGEAAARFYQAYKNSPNRQQLQFVDLNNQRVGKPIAGEGSPIIGGDFEQKLAHPGNRYSGIILAEKIGCLSQELLERLVRTQFHTTRVYTLESFYETHWRYVPLDAIDPVWPLQTGFQLARISPYHYLKRLFDVIFSAILLVILAPLLLTIACLIWLTSKRPIVFRQERVGREGHRFIAYKFRTMRQSGALPLSDNGSQLSGEDIYTRKDDPRVTRLGSWLRKLRLDELPQLWNVFRGDMSLIGPRAEWVKCAERYEKKIPFYHFRHLVKPGITGWAQVNYPYGESDEDAIEKLKYDLYYIRHYSLKLDAMIVLKTVHTMLFGKGR